MPKHITVGLVGNPNAGKTTVFNNITGAHQHVGNWPGVTVEKREGSRNYKDYAMNIVDLPGVYSLTAYSIDEIISRNFIIDEKPDIVVNIVDASNLERNLYLTIQLLEMAIPLVVALNMIDAAASRGYEINIPELSRLLKKPIVPLIASQNQGTDQLLDEVINMMENPFPQEQPRIEYGREIEEEISNLEQLIEQDKELASNYSPRWLAIKLLEEDEETIKKIKRMHLG